MFTAQLATRHFITKCTVVPESYMNSEGKNGIPVTYTKTVYVVVQYYPWFKFSFLLFLGIVIYDNEFERKEKKI